MVAGIRHLRLVPADAKHAYSMRPEALKQLIQEDLDAGGCGVRGLCMNRVLGRHG